MDKFTRNYSIVLASIALIWLVWALYEDPKLSEINDLLKQDKIVSSYPYKFRLLRLSNGVAVLSTPRTSEFPVYKALGVIYPHLANRAQDNPDLVQAQQQLAEVQKRVSRIVMESDNVQQVKWELDRIWLAQHGVVLQP